MTAVNCVNRIVRGDRPDRQFVAVVRGVQSIMVERHARGADREAEAASGLPVRRFT